MLSKVLLLLCVVCVSQSAYLDTLDKCNLQPDDTLDEVCCRNIFGSVIQHLSKSGQPEYDIPVLDPLQLTNLSVPILNVLDLSLVNGTVKGFKTCVVNKYTVNIATGFAHLDVTCDIKVKGHYKAYSSNELVKTLFGGDSVRGDGNAKVKIEKLHIQFGYNFVLKRRDGEIYMIITTDKVEYKYKILGKMIFAADNLYLGNVESSKLIVDVLNQNWRSLFGTFGDVFISKALDIVLSIIKKFFNNVPTKYLIVENIDKFLN